jgi:hypothetical protein
MRETVSGGWNSQVVIPCHEEGGSIDGSGGLSNLEYP